MYFVRAQRVELPPPSPYPLEKRNIYLAWSLPTGVLGREYLQTRDHGLRPGSLVPLPGLYVHTPTRCTRTNSVIVIGRVARCGGGGGGGGDEPRPPPAFVPRLREVGVVAYVLFFARSQIAARLGPACPSRHPWHPWSPHDDRGHRLTPSTHAAQGAISRNQAQAWFARHPAQQRSRNPPTLTPTDITPERTAHPVPARFSRTKMHAANWPEAKHGTYSSSQNVMSRWLHRAGGWIALSPPPVAPSWPSHVSRQTSRIGQPKYGLFIAVCRYRPSAGRLLARACLLPAPIYLASVGSHVRGGLRSDPAALP